MPQKSKNPFEIIKDYFHSPKKDESLRFVIPAGDLEYIGIPIYQDSQSIETLYAQITSHSDEQQRVQISSKHARKLSGKLTAGSLIQALQLPSADLGSNLESESGNVSEISFSTPSAKKLKTIYSYLKKHQLLLGVKSEEDIIKGLQNSPSFILIKDLFKLTNISTPLVAKGGTYPFSFSATYPADKPYGYMEFHTVGVAPQIKVTFGAEHIALRIHHWLRGMGDIFMFYAQRPDCRDKWTPESQNLLINAMQIFGLASLESLSPPLIKIKPIFAESGSLGLRRIENSICPICNQTPLSSISFGRSTIENTICDLCQKRAIDVVLKQNPLKPRKKKKVASK